MMRNRIDKFLWRLPKERRIQTGDFYEDCSGHICKCTQVNYFYWERTWRKFTHIFRDLDIVGKCFVVPGETHSCSARHCAPVKLKPFNEQFGG